MKRVFQSLIDNDKGDCFAAALASILEIEVPNFYMGEHNFWKNVRDFLAPLGLSYVAIDREHFNGQYSALSILNGYCVLTMPSQRFENGCHCIVGSLTDGFIDLIHDPNPLNKPYEIDDVLAIGFLVKVFPVTEEP